MNLSYNPKIITAYFAEHGIPAPEFEYKFHPTRKWRFDLAWPTNAVTLKIGQGAYCLIKPLAIEVQGGIWSHGRHNRGAALIKEWEKLNTACIFGWRILYFQPSDLCLESTCQMIKRALNL